MIASALRFLPVVLVVSLCGFSTPVFAAVCCPNTNCVPSGYGLGCYYKGTFNSCGVGYVCGNSSSGGGGGGGGTGGGTYGPAGGLPGRGPSCQPVYSDQAAATDQCVASLSQAQFWGCLFEDDFNRSEDTRTGVSCPVRLGRLAKMCKPRCAQFVSEATNCELLDNVWQRAFTTKDRPRVTFGFTVGSADVNFCGTIRSKILSAGGVGRIGAHSRTLPPRPRVYQPFF